MRPFPHCSNQTIAEEQQADPFSGSDNDLYLSSRPVLRCFPYHQKEGMVMSTAVLHPTTDTLETFCHQAKQLILSGSYDQCHEIACQALSEYPDAPQPHNILGILLEKTGHHPIAMNHFRAALALDASYRPASQNLATYGTFYATGNCAFEEQDCVSEHPFGYTIVYDNNHVGHVVRDK